MDFMQFQGFVQPVIARRERVCDSPCMDVDDLFESCAPKAPACAQARSRVKLEYDEPSPTVTMDEATTLEDEEESDTCYELVYNTRVVVERRAAIEGADDDDDVEAEDISDERCHEVLNLLKCRRCSELPNATDIRLYVCGHIFCQACTVGQDVCACCGARIRAVNPLVLQQIRTVLAANSLYSTGHV